MTNLLETEFLEYFLQNHAIAIAPTTSGVDIILCKSTFDAEAGTFTPATVTSGGTVTAGNITVTNGVATFPEITIVVGETTTITGFYIRPAGSSTAQAMFADTLNISVTDGDSVQFAATTGLTITAA